MVSKKSRAVVREINIEDYVIVSVVLQQDHV